MSHGSSLLWPSPLQSRYSCRLRHQQACIDHALRHRHCQIAHRRIGDIPSIVGLGPEVCFRCPMRTTIEAPIVRPNCGRMMAEHRHETGTKQDSFGTKREPRSRNVSMNVNSVSFVAPHTHTILNLSLSFAAIGCDMIRAGERVGTGLTQLFQASSGLSLYANE